MRIRGYWGEHDAPYLRVRVICSSPKINQNLAFLIDSGASRTTLLDRDAQLKLRLPFDKLKSHPQSTVGIGGVVETYMLEEVRLLFVADSVLHTVRLSHMPVLRHTPGDPGERERIRFLPSVIGRDILNDFEVTLNRKKRIVRLTD